MSHFSLTNMSHKYFFAIFTEYSIIEYIFAILQIIIEAFALKPAHKNW